MSGMIEAGLVGLLVLAAGTDRPVLPPRHDVAVTYRTTGAAAALIPDGGPLGGLGGGPGSGPAGAIGQMRLRWNASGLLRLEADGRPQVLLLETAGPSAHIIDSGLRSAISLPMKRRDIDAITLASADMARVREDRVAGLACTVWSVHTRNGNGTVCVTPDGVPLRAEGAVDGKQGTLTATAVDMAPQPAELFKIPPGYMSFSLPKFGK